MSVLTNVNDVSILSNQSMGASFTSPSILINKLQGFSIQPVWTGSPVGTFSLAYSCDPGNPAAEPPAGNFTTDSTSTTSTSGVSNIFFNFLNPNADFNWVQLIYTRVSGSGTLTTAYFNQR